MYTCRCVCTGLHVHVDVHGDVHVYVHDYMYTCISDGPN